MENSSNHYEAAPSKDWSPVQLGELFKLDKIQGEGNKAEYLSKTGQNYGETQCQRTKTFYLVQEDNPKIPPNLNADTSPLNSSLICREGEVFSV